MSHNFFLHFLVFIPPSLFFSLHTISFSSPPIPHAHSPRYRNLPLAIFNVLPNQTKWLSVFIHYLPPWANILSHIIYRVRTEDIICFCEEISIWNLRGEWHWHIHLATTGPISKTKGMSCLVTVHGFVVCLKFRCCALICMNACRKEWLLASLTGRARGGLEG